MSLLRALAPVMPQNRYATVLESMLDGTYRVQIDGITRRVSSSLASPPSRGAQVIIGYVSGQETIISTGMQHSPNISEVTING